MVLGLKDSHVTEEIMSSVLIGYVIGDNKSGIDTYVLNVSKTLKEAGYDIDFLTNEKTDYMVRFCEEKGIGLIEIPSLKKIPQQLKCMKEIFANKQYDIAYFNISEAFNSIGAIAAKMAKIKKVIIHSHSSSVGGSSAMTKTVRKILHVIFKKLVIKNVATDYLACSNLAAEWMFDKDIIKRGKCVIVNNAVEVTKFEFNPLVRDKKREVLDLQDNFIIGHVSGFTPTKNVPFIVDILNAAKDIDPSVHLLLVGEGVEFESVKEKIHFLELEQYVTLLGSRTDVDELLQVMDAFLLPSLFEGAPIVAIEAQVSGLMVYLSDGVTREVKLSEKCHYMSLNDSPEEWAKEILSRKSYERENTDFSNASYCFDTKKQKEELLTIFR